jgi:hypothetical protein
VSPRSSHITGRPDSRIEHALSEYDKVIGPALTEDQMHEYETARTEYVSALESNGALATAPHFGAVRSRYEKLLGDYSRAVLRLAEGPMSHNGKCRAAIRRSARCYEGAVRAYEEAEHHYEEKHKPYEEALAAASGAYERAAS